MRAGKLRTRIAIEYQPAELDLFGEASADWATLSRPWAHIESAETDEANTPTGTLSQTKYAITIRYRVGVTTKHRIRLQGRILQILSIADPDMRRRELQITAVELPGEAS